MLTLKRLVQLAGPVGLLTLLSCFFTTAVLAQQKVEINIKVVQQRFCVAQGVKKAKASIQINVPAGNCDVEEMDIDWNDSKPDDKFKVSIPSSTKDTSFTREHEYDLTDCLYDSRYTILLTSTFKASCKLLPNYAPGIVLFTTFPSATINPSPSPACVNQNVDLGITFCPITNVTYSIDYGDGTTGTDLRHAYTKTGDYTMTVKASNVCNNNNPAVTTKKLSIIDRAVPKIGPDSGRVVSVRADTSTICFDGGGIIRLDGIGSINANQYEWEITPAVEYLEKTSYTSANPKIRFVKPGTYTIKLRVNNICGIWSDQIKCIHDVVDLPTLALDTPPSVCTDFRYRPTPFDKNATYMINGKALPASGDTLLKLSNTPYTVLVEGRIDNICGGTPRSVSFTVGNAQPVIILSPRRDTLLCAGTTDLPLRTNLTDGKWDPNPVIVLRGGSYFFVPKDTGTYTLRYVRGTGNCLRDTTIKIRVGGVNVSVSNFTTCRSETFLKLSPSAGTWSAPTGCSGCIRNDTLLLKNIPPTQTSLSLTYSLTSAQGCSTSASAVVTIGQPLSSFSITNGCSDKPFLVTNKSTGATSYQWLVNGISVSTAREPVLTLPAGRVQVMLIASAGSCSNTASQEVVITAPPVRTSIAPRDTSGCSPLPVAFRQSGAAQTGVTYNWDFGNQKTSSLFQPAPQTFVNTGRQPQSYTVILQGRTSCGTVGDTVRVTVRPQAKAEIGVDSTTLRCPPAIITFSNRSTGFQGPAIWDFGDQSPPVSTTLAVVTHQYNNPDKTQLYTVRLLVKSTCGDNTDSVKITVLPAKTSPLFTISKSKICPGESIMFTDASSPKPMRVTWEIDGKQLSGTIISYDKFTKPNTAYKIFQTVYPVCGGPVSYEQTINTGSAEMGSFLIPMVACPGQPVSLTNTSAPALGYRWDFGDNSAIDSTYYSPVHTYTAGGKIYTVNLTVITYPLRCTSVVSHTITIRTNPTPDFSVTNAGIVCSDTLVSFQDKSQNATAWKWYDGNGNLFSTAQNPQVRFAKGTYDVKLWVSNNGLCADSVYKQDVFRVDTCVIYVANIFTPNKDGSSEFFNLYGSNLSKIRELHVFSRWGTEVYFGKDVTPNSQTEGWDGQHLNKALPPDDYVYEAIVEFAGGAIKRKHGVITLLR